MKKLYIYLVCFLFTSSAQAEDYTVRQFEGKSGACYHNEKRVSGARFCHNCLSSGGNNVIWKFRVYCDGKPTEKLFKTSLQCRKQSIPEEGEQLRTLYEKAEGIMDDNLQLFSSIRDCNLGGWK